MTDNEAPRQIRDRNGKFLPGRSGNPSGRPKTLLPDGRSPSELYRGDAVAVHAKLLQIIMDDSIPAAPRVAAVKEFNDRAFGRPAQTIIQETEDALGREVDMSIIPTELLDRMAKQVLGDDEAA